MKQPMKYFGARNQDRHPFRIIDFRTADLISNYDICLIKRMRF